MPPQATASLERRLGPLDAAAVVVSNVIGSGILITPAFIAINAPSAGAMLAVWLAGGLLAFAGAMAYAELATLRPRAGGEYVYLRAAFGELAGFLTGWTSFVAGFSGAIAASAVGLASYVSRIVPAVDDSTLFALPLGFTTLALTPQRSLAIVAILALSYVHARGLGPGRIVQNLLAVAKVLLLLGFVAAGFAIGRGTMAHFDMGAPPAMSNWLLALVPAMFSYSGWNAAAYVAEEIRDPDRNVPRAFALGTVTIVLVYIALNLLYVYAMPVSDLVGLRVRVIDAAADRLFGTTVGDLLTVLTLFILTGSISAMVFAGPRVYFAMARDGLFFAPAARVHPHHRTPAFATWMQAGWSCLLVVTGTFGQLVDYTGFSVILFSAVAVGGLFVLRRREPDAPRPFSALGYPVAPAVFVVVSLAIVVNAIVSNPGPSLAGVGIILAGVPLYLWFSARRRVA